MLDLPQQCVSDDTSALKATAVECMRKSIIPQVPLTNTHQPESGRRLSSAAPASARSRYNRHADALILKMHAITEQTHGQSLPPLHVRTQCEQVPTWGAHMQTAAAITDSSPASSCTTAYRSFRKEGRSNCWPGPHTRILANSSMYSALVILKQNTYLLP